MTETARESNGDHSRDVTATRDAAPGHDAATPDVPKSISPSRDKRSSAPESEVPTKTTKKRRKVNHGMALMLYTHVAPTGLLIRHFSSSVHILQTFGELPPPASNTLHYAASETYCNDR
jgi:hypothetical protein